MSAVELDLDAIRARVDAVTEARDRWTRVRGTQRRTGKTFARETWLGAAVESAIDVPALLAEVERLRADVAGMTHLAEWLRGARNRRRAERDAARAALADTVPAAAVRKAAEQAQEDYLAAIDEVRHLPESSREHNEWMANAHAAAETRDALRALLPGTDQ